MHIFITLDRDKVCKDAIGVLIGMAFPDRALECMEEEIRGSRGTISSGVHSVSHSLTQHTLLQTHLNSSSHPPSCILSASYPASPCPVHPALPRA